MNPHPAPGRTGHVDTGHIHTGRIGSGARDVLAIHCSLAHSGAWKGLAARMPGLTLHVFDMPSHGRSADWDPAQGDYQDLGTAAAHRLLDRKMDIIGHSFGATVALRVAAERPGMVRSLTLVEPVFFAAAIADAPGLVADHDARARPFFEALDAGDAETAARLFNRMWSPDARWDDLPGSARAAMTRAIHVVPASAPAIYDDRAGLLKPGVLARITAPVLLLRGSETDPVMAAINDALARRLPDAVSLEVPGAGHMLPISHPDLMAAALRDLFARS
ncbi:MAG: alpha/beta hydrolase [Rhodobacteraceae bacterium]|nr:MAG: alpha/beta hydrolase [Paracoccaceae bacterium]